MGKLLPNYKKALFDELVNGITSNSSQYYAFASNPVTYNGTVPELTGDDFTTYFTNDWQMLFGKKISNTDVLPVIKNIEWQSGLVFDRYDNTLDLTNSQFYAVVSPSIPGGYYNIFKCIDNNNNSVSTAIPDQVQSAAFLKSDDGYTWRYITSISSANYTKFSTVDYIPIYANNTIASSAANNVGVDSVRISNNGIGYKVYASGIVSGGNTSVIQLDGTASTDQNFYTKSGIFLKNTSIPNAGVFTVTNYVSNGSGNYIFLNTSADPSLLISGQTEYIISPKVVFETDGDLDPVAYSVVNTSTNSISSVIILDAGTNISRANVSIVSNTYYGSQASCYAIVTPPGGHGSSPETELFMQGYSMAFTFANSQSDTIPTNTLYNKIGIVKNPHAINANGTKSSTRFSSNTFSSITRATIESGNSFNVGTQVVGQNTSALGTVVFSNTSTVYLTGDKYFTDERIVSTDNLSAEIAINTNGDVFTKDLIPMYVQNIADVNRSNTQSESFKLIIQI